MKFSKEDIEKILGWKLLDFEYEVIVEWIKAFRDEKKRILWARGNTKTELQNTACVLSGILPKEVIFEEVDHE